MRLWKWGFVILLAIWAGGCGGNSTSVSVTIFPATSQTVLLNNTDPFSGVASGSSTTTVFWQICLPPMTSTLQPTNCTQGVGPAGCTIPTVAAPLVGFGTITATGLYTAPGKVPAPNNFVVMASACINSAAFATVPMTVDSGITVQITPTTATIGTGEFFQFAVTVTNPANNNTGVTWLVNGVAGGGVGCITANGCISASGNYQAPTAVPNGPVTVTAQSSADPSKQGTASVTVELFAPPALANANPLVPAAAAQGSVQQDVYLNGSNFLSTTAVLVNNVNTPATFISTSLMRVTIPQSLLQQNQFLTILPISQGGQKANSAQIDVVPVRPAVVFSTPDTVSPVNADVNVVVTGGFFSPGGNPPGATNATFNGVALAPPTVTDSRHITVTIPKGGLAIPGLYPITVQNNGVAPIAGLNFAVQPASADISGLPAKTLGVGTGPSAIAIDPALGVAVVVNTAANSVTIINLATFATTTVGVGLGPTGVAIDDQLPDHLALVVNNTDQTLSVVDLSLQTVVGAALPLSIGPKAMSPAPFSIGMNSQTHRGIITYQTSNQAMIIDTVTPNPFFTPACATPPCPVSLIGGSVGVGPPSYATGQNPAVAIDPDLNWAVVTPGGQGGGINIVDLGREAVPASGLNPAVFARAPSLVGVGTVSQSTQGIGINTETHQLLLSDPKGTNLTEFSLLDNTNAALTFTLGGVPLNNMGFVATGANPLTNVGIGVNTDGTAVVVDTAAGKVLQTVTVGTTPQAVAVDSAHNQAVVVNQGSNNVSIVSLGSSFRALQIAEMNPTTTFVVNPPVDLPLTINGDGFVGGLAQVLLDGTPIAGTVTNGGRTVTATVPAAMLASARHYSVTVQNTGSTDTSNIASLNVIQPVSVGKAPFGGAIDTTNDIAVVTNSVDGTASLVNLLTGTVINPASPLPVGATPEGVAVNSRLGLAVVANFADNTLSVLDDTGNTSNVVTTKTCGSNCSGPTGVAIDPDQNRAAIAGSLSDTVSFINALSDSGGGGNSNLASPPTAPNPLAVAIDPNPNFNYAAVGTSSQASTLDLFNATTSSLVDRVNNMEGPSGVVFDPVNQVFVVANGLGNTVAIVDPVTFNVTFVPVGINPTSIDYNFQASTLVTFNSASNTLSVLDYVCPPTVNNAPNCEAPKARGIVGLGSSPQFSLAIDPKLNLIVLVDMANNRVLLVPPIH